MEIWPWRSPCMPISNNNSNSNYLDLILIHPWEKIPQFPKLLRKNNPSRYLKLNRNYCKIGKIQISKILQCLKSKCHQNYCAQISQIDQWWLHSLNFLKRSRKKNRNRINLLKKEHYLLTHSAIQWLIFCQKVISTLEILDTDESVPLREPIREFTHKIKGEPNKGKTFNYMSSKNSMRDELFKNKL
jgi:hypothetical protein